MIKNISALKRERGLFKALVISFLFLIVISSGLFAQGKQDKNKQWNIVLFIADDLSVNDIGPYGNKVVRTPYLDEFDQKSMRFSQAFAGSPTCGPSRSSILTGLLPFRHGGHSNHSGVRPGTYSIIQHLKPLGYKVAIAGKLHVGPAEVFPFEKIAHTNVPEPGFENRPGLHHDLNLGPVDKWLSGQKKSNEPFMLVVADHSPHVIWPEDASYEPDEMDVPSKHIDTKDTRFSRARYYTDITKMDKNFGHLLQSIKENGLEENTIIIFTSDQGPQWPFAKWTLYDEGIQVPLMVHWPGKTNQSMHTNALVSHVDLFPTFMDILGGDVPKDLDGSSFMPVLAGEKFSHREYVYASHTGDGKMNRSPSRMIRTDRYKYILNLAPEILYTTHMDKSKNHDGGKQYWNSWVDASYKDEHAANVLWRYHNHPREELYDIQRDPQETVNLAEDPAYQALMDSFRKNMETWRKGQGDFETGPEALDNKQPGGKPVAPYVF
ncbi:sulfatase [Echinicola marina]|uniref:sulfatase family protein n=1 Tax=Echinicola marina TaxID=2859768 RepID=UPI001CF6C98D|nr:sulfatase [Echinicola marina]UCS94028.1 sulfatase [Echinicola marina]